MSSTSFVTTRPYVTDLFEWEVKDLYPHFQQCEHCSKDLEHNCPYTVTVQSPAMDIRMDEEKFTRWYLTWNKITDRVPRKQVLTIALSCDGVIKNDDWPDCVPFDCKYELTVFGGPPDNMKIIALKSGKTRFSSLATKVTEVVCPMSTFFSPIKGMWPHGSLKVAVKMIRLLNITHKLSAENKCDQTFKSSWCSSFGQLLNNPHLSDTKILCGGSSFYAHKLILQVKSRVFCAMLEAEMIESKNKEIKITDLNVDTVEKMLKYIYTGEIVIPFDYKDLLELLDCAEKYELEEVKAACLKKMTTIVDDHNVGEFSLAAETYGASLSAITVIKNYCMRNHERLIANPDYRKRFLANPQAFIL